MGFKGWEDLWARVMKTAPSRAERKNAKSDSSANIVPFVRGALFAAESGGDEAARREARNPLPYLPADSSPHVVKFRLVSAPSLPPYLWFVIRPM